MEIFPSTPLTETEEAIIVEILSNPTLRKYLHIRAYNIGKDIVTASPGVQEPAEEWLRKEINLKGQLREIDTLLSIKPSPKSTVGE